MRLSLSATRNADVVLIAGLAVVFVFASWWLTRRGVPLPPDAIEYADVARSLVRGQGYTVNLVEIHAGRPGTLRHLHELHGLLQPFLFAPLLALSPSYVILALPGIVLTGTTVLAGTLLARRVFGRAAGLACGGLLLCNDTIAFRGALGSDDVGWAFFTTLALWCLFEATAAIEPARPRWLLGLGLFGALAILQKVPGVVLPLVLAPLLVIHGPTRSLFGLKGAAFAFAPMCAAFGVYLARNHSLHGGLGFRFGGLDWLWRDDPRAYFGFYPEGMSVGQAWRLLGHERAIAAVTSQFSLLHILLEQDPFMFLAGPLALAWLATRRAFFGILGLSYAVALVIVVCVAYHLESRYVLALHPIFSAAIAGCSIQALSRLRDRLAPAGRARLFDRVATGVAVIAFAWGFFRVLRVQDQLGTLGRNPVPCEDVYARVRQETRDDEAILSASPWYVNWFTERPSVMVPTNGAEAVSTIVRHYGVRWAIGGMQGYGTTDVEEALATPSSGSGPISTSLVFAGEQCKLYRLNWD